MFLHAQVFFCAASNLEVWELVVKAFSFGFVYGLDHEECGDTRAR